MADAKSPARAWLAQQTALGRRTAAPVIVAGLAGTGLGICQAVIAGRLLAGAAHREWLLVTFALCALLRAAVVFAMECAAAGAGAIARRRLRNAALGAIVASGPALLRQRHSAELAGIVIDRIELLDGFFARYVPATLLALAAPGCVLVAALALDPFAALVLLLAGLLVPAGMALAGIGAGVAANRQLQALTHLQVRFIDRVRGIATIVLAGRAEDETAALARAADELRRRTMRVLRVAFLSSTVLDLAAAAALVALALHYAAHLRSHVAVAVAMLLLVPEFFAPLRAFAAAYQDRSHAASTAESLVALPAPPVQAAAPAAPPAVRTVRAHGVTVAFESVTVSLDPSRPPALADVSFRLAAGETLMLIGPSGAGKTTVLEVLLGFVRPQSGRVTFNGADSAAIVPQALSRLVGWVGQTPMLFAATIEENIRFAQPDASAEELHAAIRAARLDGVLERLPQGLATRIGEGGYGLSGGQAQRVAVARAFLRDAPLLLLDEPTAHLDAATEKDLLDSLRRLALGRTVIMASHSAAAHAFAGRQLHLRGGRLVREASASAA